MIARNKEHLCKFQTNVTAGLWCSLIFRAPTRTSLPGPPSASTSTSPPGSRVPSTTTSSSAQVPHPDPEKNPEQPVSKPDSSFRRDSKPGSVGRWTHPRPTFWTTGGLFRRRSGLRSSLTTLPRSRARRTRSWPCGSRSSWQIRRTDHWGWPEAPTSSSRIRWIRCQSCWTCCGWSDERTWPSWSRKTSVPGSEAAFGTMT